MKRWLLTLPLLMALFSVLSGGAHRGQANDAYIPPVASAVWAATCVAHDWSWQSGLDALVAEIEDSAATFEEAEEEKSEKDAAEKRSLPHGQAELWLGRSDRSELDTKFGSCPTDVQRSRVDARQHAARAPPRLG